MVGVLCGGLVDVKNVPAGEQVQVAVFGVGQCLQLIHVLEYGGAVAGLEVAEVDVKAACLQMLHVLAQAARGVVASEVGQVLFVAGEGGFCYQPAQALALAALADAGCRAGLVLAAAERLCDHRGVLWRPGGVFVPLSGRPQPV